MIYYVFLFITFTLFSYLSTCKEFKKVSLPFFIATTYFLVFFAGLRGIGVGADDYQYVVKFLQVPDISYWFDGTFQYTFSKTWMEPAYIFWGAFIRWFTDDPLYLFLSVAAFSVGLACINYYNYSPYPFLSVLLFFSHTFLYRDINQIRSACAAAIGLFLISQIHKREHGKIIFTIALCALFHSASLAFLVIYFLSFFSVSRLKLVILVFMGVFIGALGVSNLLIGSLPGLGFVTEKLVNYSNTSKYADSVSLFDITNLKNLAFFFILIFLWRKLEIKVKYFDTMMLFLAVATFWRTAFSDFGIFAARIATFFSIVEVILLPCIILGFKQKRVVMTILIFYGFVTLILNLFFKEGRNPYFISPNIF